MCEFSFISICNMHTIIKMCPLFIFSTNNNNIYNNKINSYLIQILLTYREYWYAIVSAGIYTIIRKLIPTDKILCDDFLNMKRKRK